MVNLISSIKLYATKNLTWSINGSVLSLSADDVSQRQCNNSDVQKFVVSVPQVSTFSATDLNALQQNLAALSNIDPSRINITQRPNDENQNKDGEIIVSISKSNGTGPEHSAVIYNLSQSFNQNQTNLQNVFSGTNINSNQVKINTLTFNETVGTTSGCFKSQDPSSLGLLFLGNQIDCTPIVSNNNLKTNQTQSLINNNSDNTNSIPISTMIIIVGIGMIVTVIIVVVILMALPGTRHIIFPSQKIRGNLKRGTQEL